MKKISYWLWLITMGPIVLAFAMPNLRKFVFHPVRNFSGHGNFFNRFAKYSPQHPNGVLPRWALVVYILWFKPIFIYKMGMVQHGETRPGRLQL